MNDQELASFRHTLHAHPELSGGEVQTAKRVAEALHDCHPARLIEGLGGTGIAAVFESGGAPGPTVLFRAELDALPISETNEFDHRSRSSGVSHKCGHDGHAAILVGLARRLHEHGPQSGRVVLLFQPAEETGEGAERVCADPRFGEILPDYAFALHNLPGYPLGTVLVKSGVFAAASTGMIATLTGRTAHAAEPEKGVNPAQALARIISEIGALSTRGKRRDAEDRQARDERAEDEQAGLATIVSVRLGDRAFGTSPGTGELMVTWRAFSDSALSRMTDAAETMIATVAAEEGLASSVRYEERFPVLRNDAAAVETVRRAARAAGADCMELERPFRWSEDFAHILRGTPGALFGLGAGEAHAALHSEEYDFPDELIPLGVALFDAIRLDLLDSN